MIALSIFPRRTVVGILLGIAVPGFALMGASTLSAQRRGAPVLPPVTAPEANPITDAKALLGKALFWEEQLSADDTVACGTCHRPASGGADPRFRRHPGPDGKLLTRDDIFGSPGIASPALHEAATGDDPRPQITGRRSPSALDAMYAPALFWDGRATSQFTDPQSGKVLIESGGALESQALGPILSDVEMAHPGRDWAAVTRKLARSRPLALATEVPAPLAAAARAHPDYASWFTEVFEADEALAHDAPVTAARIAFAIATYERTLVSDQTPYDRWAAGDDQAMTSNQVRGFAQFRRARCDECHTPPHFTDHQFRNIGVRPYREDTGRQQVTEAHADRGKFKVPTLRNVGLRPRLMHNGEFDSLANAVRFYHFSQRFGRERTNNDPILGRGLPIQPFALEESPLVDFLRNALTDPRVTAESAPFDRPKLRSEQAAPGVRR